MSQWRILATAGLGLVLSACVTTQPRLVQISQTAYAEADPAEAWNRKVLKFNQGFQKAAVKPALNTYRAVTPKPARKMLYTLLDLLQAPFSFGNAILQGDPKRARQVLDRALINGTIGMGLNDVATEMGHPEAVEDLGQTLAVWGVPSGAYLVIPFLGPTTIRDGLGLGAQVWADPTSAVFTSQGWTGWDWGRTAADFAKALDLNLDSLTALEESSVDFYPALRSAYRQFRAAEIRNGAEAPLDPESDPLEELESLPNSGKTADGAPPQNGTP
jgi:phospholipid-binding lipoprotein MlaA